MCEYEFCLHLKLYHCRVSGNEAFCKEVTKWGFHERGVLELSGMHHNLVNQTEQLTWYRIKDDIEFSVYIHELLDGRWQPFK